MKKMIFKNNKGVAMISVMIAITFIAIVGSAMLIISTSNYAMKSSNVFSKQNSYSTDAELTKTVSTIRNTVLGSNPNVSNFSSLKDDVSANKYDCKKIMGLVYPGETIHGDSKDAYININNKDASGNVISKEVIHFKSSDNNCSLTQSTVPDPANPGNDLTGVTRYTFKNFVVTNTTTYGASDFNPKEKSYFNSSKTDIVFDIYSSSSPASVGGGVGNMSLMMDSQLSVGGGQFSFLTMTGNTFITNYKLDTYGKHVISSAFNLNINGVPTSTKMSLPGNEALVTFEESKVNMAGDYNVVYGDIKLTGRSSLAVLGKLTVYGDIIIEDDATLVVGPKGAVYFMKGEFPHSDGTVRKSQVIYNNGASSTHNVYPANALDATKIYYVEDKNLKDFIDLLNLSDTDTDNDGLVYKVLRKDNFYGDDDKYVIQYTGDVNSYNDSENNIPGLTTFENNSIKGYKTTSTFNGKNIGFGFLDKNTDTINGGAHDMLLFITEGRPETRQRVKPGTGINIDHAPWYIPQEMEDVPYFVEMRQFAPNMTIISTTKLSVGVQHGMVYSKLGTEEFNYITGIKGDYSQTTGEYTSSPFNDIKVKFSTEYTHGVGNFFDRSCNSYVDQAFGYATNGGGDSSLKYASTIYFDNYEKDQVAE